MKVKVHSRKRNCFVLMFLYQPLPRLSENVISVSVLKYLCVFVILEKLSERSILVFSIVFLNFYEVCQKQIQYLKDHSSSMHRYTCLQRGNIGGILVNILLNFSIYFLSKKTFPPLALQHSLSFAT